jgi:hypothetical protein
MVTLSVALALDAAPDNATAASVLLIRLLI